MRETESPSQKSPPVEPPAPGPPFVVSRLPSGLRDWLPEQELERVGVSTQLMHQLALFGYQRLSVPPFEYADVWQHTAGQARSDEVLRFVEPESGRIVALRSDVTPQIARLVTSRFPNGPWPARFCYHATVLRRRHERARLDRQVLQVGFELVGRDEVGGDLEVLEAATSSLRRAGIDDFAVDLAHARVSGSLLESVSEERRAEIVECLSLKDSSQLERCAQRAGLRGAELRGLVALPELHGGAEVWDRAQHLLGETPAAAPLRALAHIWQAAVKAELAPRFVVDLGETRELYYYTGTMFHLLAEGPGEPLGSGGRYDSLFRRFGADLPAAGFAFDVNNICWALRGRGHAYKPLPKVLVTRPAGASSERTLQVLRQLRARGISCTRGPREGSPSAYAARWNYSHLLQLGDPSGATFCRVELAQPSPVPAESPEEIAEFVSAQLGC